jgi:hypothetical protein
MLASRSRKNVSAGIAAACLLAACATATRESEEPYSAERHYERACDSASRAIDNLMVHWENPRNSDRMPFSQVMQARQAMNIVAPACKNVSAILALDATAKARVDAALQTLESAGGNLPRLPAGN